MRSEKEILIKIRGLDCADCAPKIERAVSKAKGMKAQIKTETAAKLSFWEKRKHFMSTLASIGFTAAGIILSRLGTGQNIATPFFILAIISGGFYIARRGIAALRTLRLDINFLMTIAVIGAAFIGEWIEAAVVVILFSLAQLLEKYSMDRARNAIRSLMELSPPRALVKRNGQEMEVEVTQVKIEETIIIKPGEKVPLDGQVINGHSYVNQSPITGESMPIEKKIGDTVFAGTINHKGALEVRVTHSARDTTLAKIIHLVEEAQAQKAPSQNFVDKFAKYYTPIVVIGALLTVIIPVLFFNQPFANWLYRALVLLVISCPCALVISTPVTIVAGLARAARKGVLIKGGVYLENSGRLKALVFDKTGTLTKGRTEVIDIISLNTYNKEQVLRIAASIELRSEHHLAQAIVAKAKEWPLLIPESSDFQSIPGKGAKAKIKGVYYYIGSHRLFEERNFCTPELDEKMAELEKGAKSVVIVGNSKQTLGIIVISDAIRDNCKSTLKELRIAGIQKIAMLTGDNKGTAKAIAQELGLDEFKAELLPQDKVEAIKDFLKKHDKVAMVGDGVNDAPALAVATIGIAMGTAGTDAALETADIALMADDLRGIPFVIRLGKKALWIIKENISLALLIKAIFLALAASGLATLWMAVFADMGASLIVIFNGMRLFKLSWL